MKHSSTSAVIAAMLLAACSSTSGTRAPVSSGGPLILPAGENSYMLFREGGMDESIDGKVATEPLPATMGKPAAAGVDAQDLWAAVAFDRTFATFQLAQPDPEWKVAPWTTSPAAVSVSGRRATVTAGTHVYIYDVDDPAQAILEQDVHPWLEKTGVDQLHFAGSPSSDELFLIGYDARMSGGNAVVLRVPLKDGGENIQTVPIQQLTELDRCTSDGKLFYLAGTRVQLQRGTNLDNMRQLVTLHVFSYDPSNGRLDSILELDDHDQGRRVTDLSVGPEALALVFNGTQLEIYAPAGNRLERKSYSTPISVAWTALHQIAVSGDGAPELIQVK